MRRAPDARPATPRWFEAAARGDVRALQAQAAAGVPIDARDADGRTALIWAVNERQRAAAMWLMDRRADVNARDNHGLSVLANLMGYYGDWELVPALLDHGADINTVDVDGVSLLATACGTHPKVARMLLKRGARVARDAGGDHDVPGYCSALAAAIQARDRELVRLLLDAGAYVNSRDWYGHTSLALAAECGEDGIAALLIAHGADVNAREDAGRMRFRRGCMAMSSEDLRAYDAAGKRPRREDGRTILAVARAAGKASTVALLRKAGAR